ncbi:flagellar hook-basal body complex protein FliE [Oceanotoga sp. DSM 15011]|uniref:flagellar hook-basal body complex protein FliE n=1 Tax=Oceanotoga TaxID=1255275 RepID=UPI0021F3F70C|nr:MULTISPECIES: flagellar hook-basal body complex protein FliE [Oceanotoga]MDO7975476.1 flagellar hook-basal body complex protein FliE [Oceanotoga teriensis]UYP00020.1 flagellar hook-basal body complex protein FliE [Oceanotoga sp. DSM 15011]
MINRINKIGLESIKNADLNKNNKNLNFSKILNDAINDVNSLQNISDKATNDYATGKINDVHQAIIAAEKASLSLRLTTEVTTKIIDSYKEIMRMQL